MKKTLLILFLFLPELLQAQFAPSAGQPGSTAIYKDSAAIISWATGCTVARGYMDISNPSLGFASMGTESSALGPSNPHVVSLGDGGYAIVTFPEPAKNGPGPDLAVFENGFDDTFLELAFVEVSSDGVNFFRFSSASLTDTAMQVGSFGNIDATKINNLAGKYRAMYGTPFDLEELKGEPGLDVNNITHVKIIDAVGSIDSAYATRDGSGRKVNDPWPTAFESGGFDLDAVAVIKQAQVNIKEEQPSTGFSFYPNPVKQGEELLIKYSALEDENYLLQLFDATGRLIREDRNTKALEIKSLKAGIYFIKLFADNVFINKKIIIID